VADDVVLNPGTGGDTIAADDIGGKKFQRLKLIKGGDGVNDGDISDSNPFPVQERGAGAWGTGQHTVATGPATALPANACREVTVRALSGNTDPVYIGPSGVLTTDGHELNPGDAQTLKVNNTNLVFLIAGVASQKVSFAWC
jgi:hypothetical protein